jgi:3-oxoacyl-[acyl-carrier protein] reductase
MPTTAIVTGASRGIGRAVAHALATAGCDLLLLARHPQTLVDTATRIADTTGRAVAWEAADLSTQAGIHQAATSAKSLFPHLNVLINNAGATVRGSLFEVSDEDWQDGFNLKFYAPVRLTRALWPMLMDAQGAVVNIAGSAGRTPTADFIAGSAVNAAVLSLTKSLADQGAQDGVRVNAINPGLIATDRLQNRIDFIAARDSTDETTAAATLAAEWGVTRIGRPEEIAAMAVFLTVGGGTYCQGGVFDVDGGRTKGL